MIAAVALGKDPSRAKQTQSLTTQLILRLPHANRMVTALVDCGAHDNFLSQKLVVEEGLQAIPTSTGAHTIDGHRITIYGRHACYTQTIDMDGTEKDIKQEFLATDSDQYEVILGLS
jgi:hypothetical protein